MSDEAVDLRDGVTLNQLIAKLEELRDAVDWHDKLSVGDLPMRLETDQGTSTAIRDIWLSWHDDDEVESPHYWKVELT